MEIQILTRNTESQWNDYISRCQDATFYHQLGWKNVIERTYNLKSIYLMAIEDDQVKGVLPLFFIKNKFFGDKFISLPYAPYGGISAVNSLAVEAIFQEVVSLAKEWSAKYIEFRNLNYQNIESSIDKSYFALVLSLNKDIPSLWSQLRKSMRRYVKKSMENNLEVTLYSKDLKNFYQTYSKHMRDLGSPVHSYDFFKNIVTEFPASSNIASVNLEDRSLASIFLMNFKDTTIYGWGASSTQSLQLFPNYLLFWETIKSCAEKGVGRFDFGRSMLNEGTYTFKTGWGADPRQLFYQYFPQGTRYGETQKTNMKRRLFSSIWKRVPLPLANVLGPKLRRKFV